MALTSNQKSVLAYLNTVETATKKEIMENITFGYYHNAEKHVGDVLTRMVRAKLIHRVKVGVYKSGVDKRNLVEEIEIFQELN